MIIRIILFIFLISFCGFLKGFSQDKNAQLHDADADLKKANTEIKLLNSKIASMRKDSVKMMTKYQLKAKEFAIDSALLVNKITESSANSGQITLLRNQIKALHADSLKAVQQSAEGVKKLIGDTIALNKAIADLKKTNKDKDIEISDQKSAIANGTTVQAANTKLSQQLDKLNIQSKLKSDSIVQLKLQLKDIEPLKAENSHLRSNFLTLMVRQVIVATSGTDFDRDRLNDKLDKYNENRALLDEKVRKELDNRIAQYKALIVGSEVLSKPYDKMACTKALDSLGAHKNDAFQNSNIYTYTQYLNNYCAKNNDCFKVISSANTYANANNAAIAIKALEDKSKEISNYSFLSSELERLKDFAKSGRIMENNKKIVLQKDCN